MEQMQRQAESGAVIIEQDAEGLSMFLLEKGTADVLIDGKKVHTFQPGDMFGEASMITGEKRSATVLAVTAVTCREIDRDSYMGIFDAKAKEKLETVASSR
eukprot:SAG31_NODE_18549_length_632_cov_1.003752_1_plen_100_part_01